MMDTKSLVLYVLPSLLVALIGLGAAALYLFRQSRELTSYQLDRFRFDVERQLEHLNRQLMVTQERFKGVNHLLLDAQTADAKLSSDNQGRRDFFETLGVRRDIPVDQQMVFVLTPFHEESAETFELIKRTVEDLGFRCVRGDEEFQSANILAHILQMMVRSRLVIANISGRNPNVFYELGIAHAIGKPTLLLAQIGEPVPFDVSAIRVLLYRNHRQLAESLRTWFVQSLATV